MLASLGAKPVAALTELLWGNSTRGSLRIPITLALIDVQSQHLRHCVIHALHTNVAVGVVRRSWWQFLERQEAWRPRAKASRRTGGHHPRAGCAGIPEGEYTG